MATLNAVRQLPSPCHPGLVITVDGFIPADCKRFSINLSTSTNFLCKDIALHVNHRFDEGNVLVRNSFERGDWQTEERNGPVAPLQKNAKFKCTITSLQDKFLIGFNGQNSWEFRHRFRQERVNWLIIGGVQVCNVDFGSQSSAPAPCVAADTLQPGCYQPTPAGQDAVDKSQLPSPCHPGLVITVDGFIPSDCKRFSINLSTTPTYLGGDVAIHVNFRFDEGKVLVRNSYERSRWQTEERNGPVAPLQKNANFECTITSLQDKFLIGFNGQNCWEFRHRFCQDRVNWLIVRGVQVNDVTFTG